MVTHVKNYIKILTRIDFNLKYKIFFIVNKITFVFLSHLMNIDNTLLENRKIVLGNRIKMKWINLFLILLIYYKGYFIITLLLE